jgi:hypothetical protein
MYSQTGSMKKMGGVYTPVLFILMMSGKSFSSFFFFNYRNVFPFYTWTCFVIEFPVLKYNTRISTNKQHPYYAWLYLMFNIKKKIVQSFEIEK